MAHRLDWRWGSSSKRFGIAVKSVLLRSIRRCVSIFAFASLVLAQGTYEQAIDKLGGTDNYAVAFRWTGDLTSGVVPLMTADSRINPLAGYFITRVEVAPLLPAPTAGYVVTVRDSAGVDILNAAATSLSASMPSAYVPLNGAYLLNGTITVAVTGQSVAGAKGAVYVFLEKVTNIVNVVTSTTTGGGGGGAGGGSPPGGTVGQVQYNLDATNFGGFTPGGDVTFANPNFTVTATHLGSPLPRAQGGFELDPSSLAGIMRGGGPISAAELSGDAITAGNNVVTVKGINGQLLSGLPTGIIKNTTATGVPSNAGPTDVVGLFTGCSGTQYLGADGACHAAGSGTMTVQGGGALAAAAIVAGAGTTQAVTPSTTSTIDGSGNIATPGKMATTNSASGYVQLKGSTSGTITITVQNVAGTVTYKLPAADGTAGQAIITDGAGSLSFGSVSGNGGGGGDSPTTGIFPNFPYPMNVSVNTPVTIANTASASSIIGSGFTGTMVVPGNSLLPSSNSISIYASGVLSDAASAPTLSFLINLGGVTIATITPTLNNSMSGNGWQLSYQFRPTALSAVQGSGCLTLVDLTGKATEACASGQTTGLDFTADQTLDIQVQWGTAAASNTLTANNLTARIM